MVGISHFYCDQCGKESHFVPIHRVLKITGVSRSTIYYWIEKGWVHWIELPSQRRLICEESLLRRPVAAIKVLARTAAA